MKNILLLMMIFLTTSAISGCDKLGTPWGIEPAWKQAKALDTAQAYQEFLKRHPNSIHEAEARIALTETVLIPYYGFVGSDSVMPPVDQLKIPKKVLSAPIGNIFTRESFIMSGNMNEITVNGRMIRLSNPAYNGKEIDTVRFGKLLCALKQGGMIKDSPAMFFYLGGTRAQRDAITAYVEDSSR